MCPEGTEAEVVVIQGKDRGNNIGICADQEINGWHDCDGAAKPGRGLWVNGSTFRDCWIVLNKELTIQGDFSYRGQQLRGKVGRMLAPVYGGQTLVEMEENIGGGGGDGMGKAGHCVLVPSSIIEWKKN